MAFDGSWCMAHWYVFATPFAIAVLVYIFTRLRLFMLYQTLFRLNDTISDMDDGETDWAMKHTRSELKIFDKIDRYEEKVSAAEETLVSIRDIWIPAIALVSAFVFFCCVIATDTPWFNG